MIEVTDRLSFPMRKRVYCDKGRQLSVKSREFPIFSVVVNR